MSSKAHDEVVRDVLARAFRREGQTWDAVDNATPLAVLLGREGAVEGEGVDEAQVAVEGMVRLLGWLFEAGPHPAQAMQRLYVVARALRPELIGNLTGAEIGALFGQTRAAESHRCKLLIGTALRRAGFRHTKMPFQKSDTAVRKYAAAQKGNTHRADSVRRSA